MALIKVYVSYSYEIWDDTGTEILESNSDFNNYTECLTEATAFAEQYKLEGK